MWAWAWPGLVILGLAWPGLGFEAQALTTLLTNQSGWRYIVGPSLARWEWRRNKVVSARSRDAILTTPRNFLNLTMSQVHLVVVLVCR
ncbi:hypothetical protein DFP72DRAFT_934380 [Ephemerocybe angulata]|uniref:Secreted protein n=1 Tax=Ephemerocybe angulata TaxID=980116 RepID=A0A8H6LV16_9AGAR|nr:hypothetical protein DFP72DRAFT_934380 [Tulosesus angulatus]